MMLPSASEDGEAAMANWLTLFCDGASRGNPGRAAAGAVLYDEMGAEVEALSKALGGTEITNNVAEYEALLLGLEAARRRGARRISIRSDSELMVKQVLAEYQVRKPELRVRHTRAMTLLKQFDAWDIEHVRREKNSRADELANQTLDSALKK